MHFLFGCGALSRECTGAPSAVFQRVLRGGMVAILVVVGFVDPVVGEQPEPTKAVGQFFTDDDADGAVSFEEFACDIASEAIDRWDQSGDQCLSPEEIRKRRTPDAVKRSVSLSFPSSDVNSDVKLSEAELEEAVKKSPRVRLLFDTLDKDHDDHLTREELRAFPGMGIFRFEF